MEMIALPAWPEAANPQLVMGASAKLTVTVPHTVGSVNRKSVTRVRSAETTKLAPSPSHRPDRKAGQGIGVGARVGVAGGVSVGVGEGASTVTVTSLLTVSPQALNAATRNPWAPTGRVTVCWKGPLAPYVAMTWGPPGALRYHSR